MSYVDQIIERFGGQAEMARKLGHAHPTTVQYWKDSGHIPARRQVEVLACARKNEIELAPDDFFEATAEQSGEAA